MSVFSVVTTCKACGWKTELAFPEPKTDHFGRVSEWRDASPRKCGGCGHVHGIRFSVKEKRIRPQRVSKKLHA